MPLSFHTPAALGWVAEPPCFRDPRRCPWLQGLCVGLGVGGGEGQGRGTGEEIPHQESQRQGRALPQEPPLCPSILPFQVACCFSFLSPPPPPCSQLHGSPPPRAARKRARTENHQPTQKDWRPPPPPLAAPVPVGQATCCVHEECQHPPCSGPSPPTPACK